MKKILVSLLMITIFISCSKEEKLDPRDKFLGTWKLISSCRPNDTLSSNISYADDNKVNWYFKSDNRKMAFRQSLDTLYQENIGIPILLQNKSQLIYVNDSLLLGSTSRFSIFWPTSGESCDIRMFK